MQVVHGDFSPESRGIRMTFRRAIEKADRFWFAPWRAKTQARCGWDVSSASTSAVTYRRLSLRIRLQYKTRQHGLFHHSGDFVQAFQGGYVRSSDTRERQGYKSKESGKQRSWA